MAIYVAADHIVVGVSLLDQHAVGVVVRRVEGGVGLTDGCAKYTIPPDTPGLLPKFGAAAVPIDDSRNLVAVTTRTAAVLAVDLVDIQL